MWQFYTLEVYTNSIAFTDKINISQYMQIIVFSINNHLACDLIPWETNHIQPRVTWESALTCHRLKCLGKYHVYRHQFTQYTVKDNYHQVEKIRHDGDITKKWATFKNLWKDKKKTGQGDCQEPDSNIEASGSNFGQVLCDN